MIYWLILLSLSTLSCGSSPGDTALRNTVHDSPSALAIAGTGSGPIGGASTGSGLSVESEQKLDPETKARYLSGAPLRVKDIVAMHKSNVSDSQIVKALKKNKCYIPTDEENKELRKADLSQKVIKAMEQNYI